MKTVVDHPLVAAYLREFDSVAVAIPQDQRLMLREEIAGHLREVVPAGMPAEEAALTIAEFGSPAEVLGTSGEPAAANPPMTHNAARRRLIGAGAVLASLILVGAAVVAVARLADPPPVSVVVANPVNLPGVERTTDGTAYFEYRAAIETMPDPLPNGAEYPHGVPEGLDSGPIEDGNAGGIMENGAGRNTAQFTWLCAWEGEYLGAMADGDAERQVAAEAMLEAWVSDPIYLGSANGNAEAWGGAMLGPMRLGDPEPIKANLLDTCAQAGIRVDPFA